MSKSTLLLIARSEFSNVARSSVVIVTIAVMVLLVILNGEGASSILPMLKMMGYQDPFVQGWSNTFYYTLMILSFMSLGIGVLSVSGERADGSLRLLLTKPLYRKDVIAGKFIGTVSFLLLLNLFVALLNIALLMINYGGPESVTGLEKIGLFVMVMFIFSSLTYGVMMLFSMIVTGLLESLVFAMAYLYMIWFVSVPDSIGALRWINPAYQCQSAITPMASIPNWVNNSLPVFLLMIIELVAVFLMNVALFNREEI